MDALGSLLILFVFLGIGAFLAYRRWIPSFLVKRLDRFISLALRVLLFLMGLRIGQVDISAAEFQAIGILSLSYAVLTIVGTFLALIPFLGAMRRAAYRRGRGLTRGLASGQFDERPEEGEGLEGAGLTPADGSKSVGLKMKVLFLRFLEPMRLFFYVVLGLLSSLFIPFLYFIPDAAGSWTLNLLLFLIGVHLVRSGIDLKEMIKQPLMVLLPLATAVGSITLGCLAAPLFGLSFAEGGALSAGFGWYTLSGVIISDMGDPLLGSAGFLINLFRETIALFIIPLLGRMGLPWMAIGAGGATSMDVTLPLIEQSCGDYHVPMAISHGALLSFLVPFLVPFFYSMV